MTTKWAGREVTAARALWMPRVLAGGVACCRCGRTVTHNPAIKGGDWDVDHVVPRWAGGTNEPSNLWPAHARQCNRAEGGRRGAAVTNARRAQTATPRRMPPEGDRRIRPRW